MRTPSSKWRTSGAWLVGGLLMLAAATASGQIAKQQPGKPEKPAGQPWTTDEAQQQLRLFPRDPYLKYVALQLARRSQNPADIPPQLRNQGPEMPGRRDARDIDLFGLFSGSLAVQESLQLERMLEQPGIVRPGVNERGEPRRFVPVTSLKGPTIQSHPWQTMLGDRKPDISPLARCVPADFYFVEFRSLGKLLDLAEQSDLWGRYFFSQSEQSAQSQLTVDRLKRQLAVETSAISRPFYDAIVSEVAITGSDLFFRDGSDVTIIFRHKSAEVFQTQMDMYLSNAAKANPGAIRSRGDYLGVPYVHVTSPQRDVHVFSAYPQPDLHVRSNSLIGFQRVLAAIRGRDAQGEVVETLGDTTEFAYIRTLLPRGAAEEDGFVYLSDPFIRQLVGPQLKLTARHRMLCYNHLRMIGHASLMYRTEQGRAPQSFHEIFAAECSPGQFGENNLVCPDNGAYQLAPDGMTAACSHHGHAGTLTPCCEIPLAEVPQDEAARYQRFLDEYNQYWRTFFDPIAIRIQATPQRYRAETIVLPLIDNSIYTGLAHFAGGHTESLDALPIPKRNIFSLAVHVDKQAIAGALGMPELVVEPGAARVEKDPQREAKFALERESAAAAQSLRQIGLAMHNYHDVHGQFPTRGGTKAGEQPRLSWRVALLRFIEEAPLHDEFHMNEPWDSEHNRKLIPRMPAVYRSSDAKLTKEGKTRFVVPVGERTAFPKSQEKMGFNGIQDGTSNTMMASVIDSAQAVVWTKPDDWEVNLDVENPFEKLAVFSDNSVLLLLCDGSVHLVRRPVRPELARGLLTRNGGEISGLGPPDAQPAMRQRNAMGLFALDGPLLQELEIGQVLSRGIGDQVGFHVYDSQQMFSMNLPALIGMFAGPASARGGLQNAQMMIPAMIVSSLHSPVYVSIPVKDRTIIDRFLDRLDEHLVRIARAGGDRSFIPVQPDFYRLTLTNGQLARSFGVSLGPVKWRLFWGRVGDGLYIASQPSILEDLAAIDAGQAEATVATPVEPSHGLVRLRPQNWREVLALYKLGWAENNREACLHNFGPLGSVQRALGAAPETDKPAKLPAATELLVGRLYGVRCFCPEGGHYQVGANDELECSLHGSALRPRQTSAPTPQSSQGRAILDLKDVQVSLRFLEDGLHAVVTIERE